MAYNRLLRETLAKLLSKRSDLDVVGQSAAVPEATVNVVNSSAHVLLLNSGGDLTNDIFIVRKLHVEAPQLRIMMVGMNDEPSEFLQCVRAGISGYVLRDASCLPGRSVL
jgi:DNA-binding NarL/FixJ family response regulator